MKHIRLSLLLFSRYLFSTRSGSVIRAISYISVISGALGFFSFLLVLSVMNGLKTSVTKRYLKAQPHLVVTADNSPKWRAFFQSIPEVQSSNPYEIHDLVLRTSSGDFTHARAKGVPRRTLEKLLKGSHPSYMVKDLKKEEILMGVDISHYLAVYEGERITALPVDTLINPMGELPLHNFLVAKGFFRFDVPEMDGKYIFYILSETLTSLKRSRGLQKGVELWLKDPYAYKKVQVRLEKVGLKSESWVQRNSSLFLALKLEKVTMGVFLGLTAFIAGLSVLTVLSLLIHQRKKDLFLLLSMGLSLKGVKGVFTGVGFLLSSLGLFIGLVLALITGYLLNKYPFDVLPDFYYDSTLPVEFNVYLFGLSTIIALAVALLNAWLPVSRLDEKFLLELR